MDEYEELLSKVHKPLVQTIHFIVSFEDFKDFIKDNPRVLLEFKAKWCHSSNMIQPHCKILSEKYVNFKFASIDVDYIGEASLKKIDSKLNLSAIPSFYLFMDGSIMDTLVAASPAKLETFIENYYEGDIVKTSNSNYEERLSKQFEWNSVASNKTNKGVRVAAQRSKLASASMKVKSTSMKVTDKNIIRKRSKSNSRI